MRRGATALAVIATLAYAVEALIQYFHYRDLSFDLAIANHTVWQWSQFQLPSNPIQGFPHELGDHFSPIYALLAPVYWFVNTPVTLLLAQAVLLGVSVIPVLAFAERRLERVPALLIAVTYVLFWGMWAGNESGFHEYAFAPLLVALALDSADRGRWRPMWTSLALLLLVKEDLGLIVAAFGVYLALKGERRRGLIAAACGLAVFVVVNVVVMPAFNGGHAGATFRRVYGGLGDTPASAARDVVVHPVHAIELMTTGPKLHLLVLLFGAFAFLTLFSPIVVVLLPALAERLLAGPAPYWLPQYHYTLLIAPLLAMGAADGLANLTRLVPAGARRAVVYGLLGSALLFAVAGTATSPPKTIFERSSYMQSPFEKAADAAITLVPRDAAVGASLPLLSHLSGRQQIYRVDAGWRQADWVVASGGDAGTQQRAGWLRVFDRGGIVVLRRIRP